MNKENNGWISVMGYESIYEINKKGQVRSLPRVIIKINGTKQTFKGKLLKTHLNSSGYLFPPNHLKRIKPMLTDLGKVIRHWRFIRY